MSEKFTTEAREITPEMASAKSMANGRKSIFITVSCSKLSRCFTACR